MSKENLMGGINERSSWREMTPARTYTGHGNSEDVITGAWRTEIPVWDEAKCKQCLLCFVACPEQLHSGGKQQTQGL
jgi:pyruvate ferredoxin oxidoreductase delta subunit